jgi:hypothetical protein
MHILLTNQQETRKARTKHLEWGKNSLECEKTFSIRIRDTRGILSGLDRKRTRTVKTYMN